MKEALKEAQKAYEDNEIPIGAIVVSGEQIIGRGYNQVERLQDATAHAEMIAITSAFNYYNSKYLEGCYLFVTLEPCLMCAGAIHWSHLSGLFYGAADTKKGFSQYNTGLFSKNMIIKSGILSYDASALLDAFFYQLRQK